MQTNVLLSIKPNFAEAIFGGTKRFEFRRTIFREPNVNRVIVYASSPVQKVLGEFTIGEILDLTLKDLWKETNRWSGIEQHYFNDYFHGCKSGYALRIIKPRRFSRPLSLQQHYGITHPPQSFRYVNC